MSVNNTLSSTAADRSAQRAQVGAGSVCLCRHTSTFNMPKGTGGDACFSLSLSPEAVMLSTSWLSPHCRELLRLEPGVLCFCSLDSSAALPAPQHAGAGNNKACRATGSKILFILLTETQRNFLTKKKKMHSSQLKYTSNVSVGLHYRKSINFCGHLLSSSAELHQLLLMSLKEDPCISETGKLTEWPTVSKSKRILCALLSGIQAAIRDLILR